MTSTTRKRIAEAIRRDYPEARVSWSGEARIVTLHVATEPGGDERILSIDTDYAATPTQVAQLIDDVLDYIS